MLVCSRTDGALLWLNAVQNAKKKGYQIIRSGKRETPVYARNDENMENPAAGSALIGHLK